VSDASHKMKAVTAAVESLIRSEVMDERERCLRLAEARMQWLYNWLKNNGHDHPGADTIRGSISNLETVRDWIAAGLTEDDTVQRNHGGSLGYPR
jgi:hypothetical protein